MNSFYWSKSNLPFFLIILSCLSQYKLSIYIEKILFVVSLQIKKRIVFEKISSKKIIHAKIKLTQFPLNISYARTVHKLQGRSLENLLVNTWVYTDNWIYVVLSRVRTSTGLHLKKPLMHSKTRGMSAECKAFHEHLRATKLPKRMESVLTMVETQKWSRWQKWWVFGWQKTGNVTCVFFGEHGRFL